MPILNTNLFESVKRMQNLMLVKNNGLIESITRAQKMMPRLDSGLVESVIRAQKTIPRLDLSLAESIISAQKMMPKFPQGFIESIDFSKGAISQSMIMSMAASKSRTFIKYSKLIEAFQKIDKVIEVTQRPLNANLLFTQFDLSDFLDEEESSEPLIVINEAARLKTIITDIFSDNKKILLLESRQFEEVIAELLRSQGFDVDLTKRTRDGGYDIMAIKKIDHHLPMKFLVECKRYSNKKIGIEIVRQFMYVVNKQSANRGIIATTSYFTKDAIIEKDANPYLLDYKDKDKVMEWIQTYCIEKGLR
jgi:HJR/Mrr/RecB family endonuclease